MKEDKEKRAYLEFLKVYALELLEDQLVIYNYGRKCITDVLFILLGRASCSSSGVVTGYNLWKTPHQ